MVYHASVSHWQAFELKWIWIDSKQILEYGYDFNPQHHSGFNRMSAFIVNFFALQFPL